MIKKGTQAIPCVPYLRSRNNSAAGEMVNELRGINTPKTLRTVPGTQLALGRVQLSFHLHNDAFTTFLSTQ